MNLKKFFNKSIVLSILSFGILNGASAGAELLGRTYLNNRGDTDFIDIRSCATEGERVSAIQLRVLQDGARIDDLDVVFGNGERQDVIVRSYFARNTSSRWIDLNGPARCIKRIKVSGESRGRNFSRQSLIEIYGFVNP